MPPSSPNVPLDVILKASIDRSGSADVKDFLETYTSHLKGAEETVSKTSSLLERIRGQLGQISDPLKQFGGLLGIAGAGAAYHQYLSQTTLGAQTALAQGHVTGGSSQFMPYTQSLLGVQAKTGVQTGEIEAGLRTTAQMLGGSLSAEGAARFGSLLAGASLTTGMSAASISQIVGSFLQSSGASGGVGGAGAATAAAGGLMAGVSQALSAFPGSQKETILPAVAGLLQGQAIGAGAAGRPLGGSAAESAAYLNSLAQINPLFRNAQIAEGGTGAIRSYLQGSISNPRALALVGGSGVSLEQALEGGPEAQAKLVTHMSELWGPQATLGLWSNLGPEGALTAQTILKRERQLGGGQTGLRRYLQQLHTAGAHAGPSAFQREAEHAILGHTPEAELEKTRAKVEGGLFGAFSDVEKVLGPVGAAAAIVGGGGLLFGAGGAAARGALGLAGRGLGGIGDVVGATTSDAGLLVGGAAVAGGALAGGVGVGLGQLGQLTGSGFLKRVGSASEELFTHPGRAFSEAGSDIWHGIFGGSSKGGLPKAPSWREMAGPGFEQHHVEHVIGEAEKKYGPNWYGPHWEQNPLRGTGRATPELANKFLHERLSSPEVGQASEIIKKLREYERLGPQGYAAKQQQESTNKFSEAVEKFVKGIEHEGNKNTAYTGSIAHQMSASYTRSALSAAPGMMLAAFLHGGASQAASTGGTVNAAYTGGGSGSMNEAWNKVLQKYSGGSYGLSYAEGLARGHPGGGMAPNARATVEADAKKYGVPFNVLWGIYGAESSWGKAASNFGLTGQFPGTGTSGNFGKDARMSAEDLKKLFESIQVHVHVDGQKARRTATKIKAVRV